MADKKSDEYLIDPVYLKHHQFIDRLFIFLVVGGSVLGGLMTWSITNIDVTGTICWALVSLFG
jgi:hypothetical protein